MLASHTPCRVEDLLWSYMDNIKWSDESTEMERALVYGHLMIFARLLMKEESDAA